MQKLKFESTIVGLNYLENGFTIYINWYYKSYALRNIIIAINWFSKESPYIFSKILFMD